MKLFFSTVIAVALLFSASAKTNADIVPYWIVNFTYDSTPSFFADAATSDYEFRFNVDNTPPTFDMPVSDFRVVKDGVDIGSQGFTGSDILMTTAGSGNLITDLFFDGSGSDITSAGTFGITFTQGDGTSVSGFFGDNQSWSYSGGGGFTGNATAAPEPGTAGLLGLALLVGGFCSRRRKS